jgi:sec-independent protein translocase protein TatA
MQWYSLNNLYICISKFETMISNILLGIIGPWQIVLIVLVVLLLFGGKKIPELMRGLGKGVREFKDGINPDEQAKNDNDSTEKKD